MTVIGITGGVGMGKSTVAALLVEAGARVVDTDDVARALVEPGSAALEEVVDAFGVGVLNSDGSLNRRALGGVVFADAESRRRLEGILHPRIRERWRTQLQLWREEQVPLAAVVIPLLYETHAESQFDHVLCVACSPSTQDERLRRRKWGSEEIESRIAAQLPVDRKLAKADYVVWTDCPLKVVHQQVDRILRSMSVDGGDRERD